MTEFNPYETPSSVVADPINPQDLQLADRSTRLAAKILDAFIGAGGLAILGIMSAIMIPTLLAQRNSALSGVTPLVVFAILTVGGTLTIMVWNLLWLHRYGQTIAKRILKIRIVGSRGERVGLGRLVGLRILLMFVLEAVPCFGLILSLVNVCFIFRDDRRCLHDLIANTIVIKADV